MEVSKYLQRNPFSSVYLAKLGDISFTGASDSIEETQRILQRNLPTAEHEGDTRQYRASYNVYLRSSTNSDDGEDQFRDPSLFIGRVGASEGQTYGTLFPDSLTIPEHVLEKEKILKGEVGYAFLSKAWGKGYATEALKAFVEAYVQSRGFWNPRFEKVYLHGVTGGANLRSRRVLEKAGFRLNGVHRWEGPDVFIGGGMQPPEVYVFSLGPSVGVLGDSS